MIFWPTHFGGTISVLSTPVIGGLTDGVAATGTMLNVRLLGQVPTGTIQWLQDGTPLPGATTDTLAVPNMPGAAISVEVDGVRSADAVIVATRVVGFTYDGAVLNPGDVITVTVDGATALAGEVELTRGGQPVPLTNGQYSVFTADVGESFVARQANMPSNQSSAQVAETTPVPTLITAPGSAGGTLEGETRSVDMTDTWAADGTPAAIVLREYRLVIGGVAGAAQASPVLTIPQGSAGQIAQAQLRARTATSALSAWEDAGGAFTIGAGIGWQISDGGNGTFSITNTPGQPPAPAVADNGNGTFSIAA
ncbi:MAG: hypothetical protein AAGF68_00250 [Pseudomonadota bacterium]